MTTCHCSLKTALTVFGPFIQTIQVSGCLNTVVVMIGAEKMDY
jgi:hypothetical protein